MQIKRLSDKKDFLGLQSQWDTLLEESGIENVFLSWEWVRVWWEIFSGPADEFFLLCGYDNEKLIGIAPLFLRAGCIRKISFLGSGAACADCLSFIVTSAYEQMFIKRCLGFLDQYRRQWDVVVLEGFHAQEQAMETLRRSAGTRRWLLAAHDEEICPYVRLGDDAGKPGPFDNSSFVTELRKKERRLKRRGELVWRAYEGAEAYGVFGDVVRLHSARWQRDVRSGSIFSNPLVTRLLAQCIAEPGSTHRVNINVLYHDGRPVAANYDFIFRKTVFHYCTGYDPAYYKFSPGNLSVFKCLEDYARRGFREFNFLRGDEPYKARWTAQRYRQHTVCIVPAKMKSRLWWAGVRLWYGIKTLMKRILPHKLRLFLHALRYNRQR